MGLPDGLFPVFGGGFFCRVDDDDRGLLSRLEDLFLSPSLDVLLEVGRPGVFDLSLEDRPSLGPRCSVS